MPANNSAVMTPAEIAAVLELHRKWLASEAGGVRADFSGRNLYCAYLYGANLRGANLTYANLHNANLTYANLRNANLYGANLSGAYLACANLTYANLYCANLTYANLYCANLTYANLTGAYLEGANLQDANLTDADLQDANLTGVKNHHYQNCPQEGTFIAYKKVSGGVVLTLEIIGERTSSMVGRKCRTSKAKVISASKPGTEFTSLHNSKFIYRIGEIVEEKDYNPNARLECATGIHFFLSKQEAEDYS